MDNLSPTLVLHLSAGVSPHIIKPAFIDPDPNLLLCRWTAMS